jgi:hypothetical protein
VLRLPMPHRGASPLVLVLFDDADPCSPLAQESKDQFCSPRCRDVHAQQQRSLAPASSVPSSPLSVSSRLSLLDLNSPPLPPPQEPSELHAEDWIGKGSEGLRAWAAAVPLGACPPSSFSPSSPPRTPSHLRIRPQKSTSSSSSSTHSIHHPSSPAKPLAQSSSTLRPSLLPSLSTRKPAPPRLFLHGSSPSHPHCPLHDNDDSVLCSPCTATCTALPHASTSSLPSQYHHHPTSPRRASPTQPILNPRTSLPSLTTQSATASLSSLATPYTTSRPPSRPQSRPSSFHPRSRAVSVAGSEHLDNARTPFDEDAEEDVEEEAEEEHTPESRPRRPGFFHTAVQRLSTGVRQWAAGERMVGHVPYSSAHVVPPQMRERAHAHIVPTPQTVITTTTTAMPQETAAPASPQPLFRPSEPIDRPLRAAKQVRAGAQSPTVMYVQDGLTRGYLERRAGELEAQAGAKMQEKNQSGVVPQREIKQKGTVRLTRGLMPARVASRIDVAAHFASAQHLPAVAAVQERSVGDRDRTLTRGDAVDAADEMVDHPAWRTRGRRTQRAERRFLQSVVAQ